MSEIKINVNSNDNDTMSISVKMKVKPPIWSKKYVKFIPNEGYARFHWADAHKYLIKEGYDVEVKPSSGPVKVNNSSEESSSGEWVFKLKKSKPTPKPKLKSTSVKKTTPQSKRGLN